MSKSLAFSREKRVDYIVKVIKTHQIRFRDSLVDDSIRCHRSRLTIRLQSTPTASLPTLALVGHFLLMDAPPVLITAGVAIEAFRRKLAGATEASRLTLGLSAAWARADVVVCVLVQLF